MAKTPKKISIKRAYGSAEGPLGFNMPDDAARLVEQALKEQPSDVRSEIKCEINGQTIDGYCRLDVVAKASDFVDGERADVSLITSESVDRDSEVILAGGGNFSSFKRNPVVTWSHRYDQLPVGFSPWQKRSASDDPRKNGWIAKTVYHSRPDEWEGPWFADAVWHLVKSKAMPGKSIGMIPLKIRQPSPDDLKKRPEYANVRLIYEKWMAIEYAVTPVQSNPDALATAISRAKSMDIEVPNDLAEDLGIFISESVPSLSELLKGIEYEDEPEAKPLPAPEDEAIMIGKIITPKMLAANKLRTMKEAALLAQARINRNLARREGRV